MLSGFVFPLEDLPAPVRAVSYFFPARYFVTAIRGIYLKGVGFEVLWPEALLLAVFATAIVGFSAARFQDRLE
jgi:ABC-2 type transport system permease protein